MFIDVFYMKAVTEARESIEAYNLFHANEYRMNVRQDPGVSITSPSLLRALSVYYHKGPAMRAATRATILVLFFTVTFFFYHLYLSQDFSIGNEDSSIYWWSQNGWPWKQYICFFFFHFRCGFLRRILRQAWATGRSTQPTQPRENSNSSWYSKNAESHKILTIDRSSANRIEIISR